MQLAATLTRNDVTKWLASVTVDMTEVGRFSKYDDAMPHTHLIRSSRLCRR